MWEIELKSGLDSKCNLSMPTKMPIRKFVIHVYTERRYENVNKFIHNYAMSVVVQFVSIHKGLLNSMYNFYNFS